jgi:hypothetical protein
MKLLLLFSALITLCLSPATAGAKVVDRRSGSAAVAQNRDAELAGVLGLLEKTLRRNGYVFVGGSWQRLTSWQSEGCRLTYVITDEGIDVRRLEQQPSYDHQSSRDQQSSVDLKKHSHAKFEFDLAGLDPESVQVRPHRNSAGGTIYYRAQGGKKQIRYELDYPKRAERWPVGWFHLKDQESLNQAAGMLREAIAICRR